jgi:methionyl-tRNA formyltransferase
LRKETAIDPDETAVDLGTRLSAMGADLLVRALAEIDTLAPEKQNDAEATYAPILKKEHGLIVWARSAGEIHNLVRGLQLWPGAYCDFRGQTLHVWRTRVDTGVCATGGRRLLARCGDGDLELLEVQLEGRKRMRGEEFARGQRITEEGVFRFGF